MGLQPHQPTRIGQGKWRDGLDHDRLQYKAGNQYHWNGKTIGKTQDLEAELFKGYVFFYSGHFKAI